jgi:hypothetical protein
MRIGIEETTVAAITFASARRTMRLREQVDTALSSRAANGSTALSAAGCGMQSPRSRTFAAANAVARNDTQDL